MEKGGRMIDLKKINPTEKYSLSEIEELTGLSRRTAKYWIVKGKLKAEREESKTAPYKILGADLIKLFKNI